MKLTPEKRKELIGKTVECLEQLIANYKASITEEKLSHSNDKATRFSIDFATIQSLLFHLEDDGTNRGY